MIKNLPKSQLGFIFLLGAVWGLSETALGLGIKSCAHMLSGSIMTGVAFFFMAACWSLTRNSLSVFLIIIITSLFKMFDALLLSLPILHKAVANPVFTFFAEGMAFIIIIAVFNKELEQKKGGQAVMGGLAALLAVNLFPLVRFVTGIPACTFPHTVYPLSLYYAPVAIFLSSLTIPLGYSLGTKIKRLENQLDKVNQRKIFNHLVSSTPIILGILILVIIRKI